MVGGIRIKNKRHASVPVSHRRVVLFSEETLGIGMAVMKAFFVAVSVASVSVAEEVVLVRT